MFLVECPYCGLRDESEFTYGGEAHIARPVDPDALTEQEWGNYLFFRTNPKGPHKERWVHTYGCRRWFNAVRDTASYQFKAVYEIGQQAPAEAFSKQEKEQEKGK